MILFNNLQMYLTDFKSHWIYICITDCCFLDNDMKRKPADGQLTLFIKQF